jgi:tripartite-type tricarboxylate transporter receptor subunit TctC
MLHLAVKYLLIAASALASTVAFAQAYPSQPIRFIVSQGPGGLSDLFARLIASKLSAAVGQPVIVDNRAGADGVIGTDLAAKAAPDGYTILLTSSGPLAILPSLGMTLPYDPNRDFQAISFLGYSTFGLFVNPALPVANVQEFISLAKSKPGQLNYGAGGAVVRIGSEMFSSAANIRMVYVPYKSNPPAVTDLIGGQIQAMFLPLVAAPQAKTGHIKLLAVHSPKRLPHLPDTPTLIESGVTGLDFTVWAGVHGPAGIPQDRVQRLNMEFAKILKLPDVIEAARVMGFEAQSSTPEELDARVKAEQVAYPKVIRQIGMTTQ